MAGNRNYFKLGTFVVCEHWTLISWWVPVLKWLPSNLIQKYSGQIVSRLFGTYESCNFTFRLPSLDICVSAFCISVHSTNHRGDKQTVFLKTKEHECRVTSVLGILAQWAMLAIEDHLSVSKLMFAAAYTNKQVKTILPSSPSCSHSCLLSKWNNGASRIPFISNTTM